MSTRDYEAMFILEHSAATADFEATSAIVDQLLEKHGAKIVQTEKWDERKLAYEIKGQRRGTYVLVYFTAETSAIAKINEDVQLNETILRHLVIALDMPIDEHIELENVERERLAEDSRKNSLGGWGGRRDRRAGSARKSRSDDDSSDDDDDGDDDRDADAPKARTNASSGDEKKADEAKAETAAATSGDATKSDD